MELTLKENYIVGTINFFNKEELMTMANQVLASVKSKQVGKDNYDYISKLKAEINNGKKLINDRRLAITRAMEEPSKRFKSEVDEVLAKLTEAYDYLNAQIKAIDDEEKEAKRTAILEAIKDWELPVCIEKLWSDKWLNKSVSINKVLEEIKEKINSINKDINLIKMMKSDFEREIIVEYLNSFDINSAITTVEKRKEALKSISKGDSDDKTMFSISFKVTGTKNQIEELSAFLKNNGYSYERI